MRRSRGKGQAVGGENERNRVSYRGYGAERVNEEIFFFGRWFYRDWKERAVVFGVWVLEKASLLVTRKENQC